MFVTFAGLRLDATNVAELGLAGHLPILHFRGAEGALETIENDHPPLGVIEHQRHQTSREAFVSGDLFVVLTDGPTEVVNARREQFGIRGVEQAIRRRLREPLSETYGCGSRPRPADRRPDAVARARTVGAPLVARTSS